MTQTGKVQPGEVYHVELNSPGISASKIQAFSEGVKKLLDQARVKPVVEGESK